MAEVAVVQRHIKLGSGHRRKSSDYLTFIEDQQLAATNYSPSQSKNLALTDREIGSTGGNRGVKGDATLFDVLLQGKESSGTEGIVQACIVVLIKRIQVLAEGSAQKLGLEMGGDRSILYSQRGIERLTI
jgi:hypothetical protein